MTRSPIYSPLLDDLPPAHRQIAVDLAVGLASDRGHRDGWVAGWLACLDGIRQRRERAATVGRDLQDRLDVERLARWEEARTGHYRTVDQRRAAAAEAVVVELFGTGQ